MEHHIQLSFGTTANRTRTIRINNPLITASDANVRDAMAAMIASNAVETLQGGRINNARRAMLVARSVESVDIFAS